MNCLEDESRKRLNKEKIKRALEESIAGHNSTTQKRAEAHQLVKRAAAGADYVEVVAGICGTNLDDLMKHFLRKP